MVFYGSCTRKIVSILLCFSSHPWNAMATTSPLPCQTSALCSSCIWNVDDSSLVWLDAGTEKSFGSNCITRGFYTPQWIPYFLVLAHTLNCCLPWMCSLDVWGTLCFIEDAIAWGHYKPQSIHKIYWYVDKMDFWFWWYIFFFSHIDDHVEAVYYYILFTTFCG